MSLKLDNSNNTIKTNQIGKDSKYKNPTVHLISGSTSGLLTCLLLQPFDLLKTRLQQPNYPGSNNLGLVSQIRIVFKESGLKGYWKGTLPTLLRNVPGMGLYFASFEQIKHLAIYVKANSSLKFQNNSLSKTELLGCGVIARTSVGFIMNPISVVKVRYESNLYNTTSVISTFRHITQQQGVKGLFSGFGATALRDAPYAGIYIYFYQLGKERLQFLNKSQTTDPNPTINLISGMAAGFLATTITHPFDLIKTRIQLQPQKYTNLFQSIGLIIKEEGIMSLYQGILMRTARKSLSSAISWTCFEQIVSYINSYY